RRPTSPFTCLRRNGITCPCFYSRLHCHRSQSAKFHARASTSEGRMSARHFLKLKSILYLVALVFAAGFLAQPLSAGDTTPGRDPKQPIDEEYTKKIQEYTTEPYFTSPLVDYLPASKTVPTPKAVLGDVAGAPGILPYSKQVYEYMRMLEKASPRVKVFSIGTTEEGREMIAVAVSS